MRSSASVLNERDRAALGRLGDALASRWMAHARITQVLPPALSALDALSPDDVVRVEAEIAAAAGLRHGFPTHAPALRKVNGLERLFLFHRDGRLREAALRKLVGPLPGAFTLATVVWRLNDWAGPVRAAALDCAARTLPATPAAIVAPTLAALLDRGSSWGRWTVERDVLDREVERPDVALALADLIGARRTGATAALLRHALRRPGLDPHLPRLARDAVQPAVRAAASRSLIDGRATWPDGRRWRWINKPDGVGRWETMLTSRPLVGDLPPREAVLDACARDRAAVVRREAIGGAIRHLLDTPEGARIAALLRADRSRSVRERARFVLERVADA